jgi:ribosome modulation factor
MKDATLRYDELEMGHRMMQRAKTDTLGHAVNQNFDAAKRELESCERGLERSQHIGWGEGIAHYSKHLPVARAAYTKASEEKAAYWEAFWKHASVWVLVVYE